MKKKEIKKKLEQEKKRMREFETSSLSSNVRNGLIISVCVIAFVFLMFTFTKIKTGEWNFFTKENFITYAAEIQTEKITCGSILNRKDEEYFVLAYDMKADNASLYTSLTEAYNNATKKISLYKVDLGNSRNQICQGDTLSITNDVKNLKLTNPTLLKVKNGKIVATINNYDEIKIELHKYVD